MRRCLTIVASLSVVMLVSGCGRVAVKKAPELEGTWVGQIANESDENLTFVFSGNFWEIRSASGQYHGKGTFLVHENTTPKAVDFAIQEFSDGDYVGQTSLAAYKIEGSKLTISACEPGSGVRPSDFLSSGDRAVFILVKQ